MKPNCWAMGPKLGGYGAKISSDGTKMGPNE